MIIGLTVHAFKAYGLVLIVFFLVCVCALIMYSPAKKKIPFLLAEAKFTVHYLLGIDACMGGTRVLNQNGSIGLPTIQCFPSRNIKWKDKQRWI